MPFATRTTSKRERANVAVRVALIYAAFGSLWILLSDQILTAFVQDPRVFTPIAIAKGWAYVAVTAALIYWMVKRHFLAAEESRHLLERSEQRYRAIVETSLDGIALTDPKGRVAFVNARMAEMLGREPEDLVTRPLSDFLPEEKCAELRRQLTQPTSGMSGRYDVYLRRPNNSELWGIASVCPMFDDHGTLVGVVTMLTDITERKRLQDGLHEAQKMQAIGQLAGGVAHDFNNLLTAIFGYTDLARRTLTQGHPALESLQGVIAAAEQAAGVSRSLLTFSRRTPANKEPANLNDVVTKAIRLLQRLLPAQIRLVTDLDDGGPALVNADATQLQQVILNLAINARDAMPDGGVLRISTRTVCDIATSEPGTPAEEAGPRVCLTVSDTGVGMTPEVADRAFEPFFTTKSKGIGTGLGLSIIHSIVAEHGGTIRLQSEPGKGTTFTISLPATTAAPSENIAAPAAPSYGGGEAILVAEDDAHVRSITASALTAAGYQVLQAPDGQALMETFERNRERIRLILTDSEMPGLSGQACLRELREQGVSIPAILVSGSLDTAMEDTMDASTVLLRKPYPVSTLLALVSQRLSRSGEKAD